MSRRYNDQEVGLILQKALEPRREAQQLEVDGGGLSLDQIKEIAAEVGIEPARIELAAASLVEPTPASPNLYVGIPTTIQFQTTLEGISVEELDHSEILAVIRAVMGRHGRVGSEFGSLEWEAKDALGARYVSLMPAKEGVRIRVMGNFRDGMLVSVAGVGGVTFAASSAVLASFLGPLGLPAAGALALVPPRFFYRWRRRSEDARLREVHERLVALLGAPLTEPPRLPDGP